MIEEKDLLAAWDRVARSEDGHLLYLYLQKRLMATSPEVESGTLRQREGARIFASELLGLMAKGIEESATGLSASCITISRSGPVAVSSARGARRRVTDDTYVPGYSPEPGEPKSGGTN